MVQDEFVERPTTRFKPDVLVHIHGIVTPVCESCSGEAIGQGFAAGLQTEIVGRVPNMGLFPVDVTERYGVEVGVDVGELGDVVGDVAVVEVFGGVVELGEEGVEGGHSYWLGFGLGWMGWIADEEGSRHRGMGIGMNDARRER